MAGPLKALREINFKIIFAPGNRGMLLDIVVFVINLMLMTILAGQFRDLLHQANENALAKVAAILFCLGLAFLQPVGAILKRRRAHQRLPELERPAPKILFHPVFYFLSKLLFLIAAAGNLVDLVFGGDKVDGSTDYFGLPPWLFTSLFLGIPALAVANTFIVYLYFEKPRHAPLFKFLQSPPSEALGDICLFLNMIGYQMFWGLLMTDLTRDYSGIMSRLFTFGFTALLIYFPPRLFYLAEDGRRPLAWLMMLLANIPILLRILLVPAS
jgi:hypothetical protein